MTPLSILYKSTLSATKTMQSNSDSLALAIDAKLLPFSDLPIAPNWHFGMKYFIPEWDDRVDP